MNEPETLIDAVRYYADRKTCFETMLSVKWPDGKIVCPKCHGELIGKIESRSMLQCKLKVCRKQFSVKENLVANHNIHTYDAAIECGGLNELARMVEFLQELAS